MPMEPTLLFVLIAVALMYVWPLIVGIGAYLVIGRRSIRFAVVQTGWAILMMIISYFLLWTIYSYVLHWSLEAGAASVGHQPSVAVQNRLNIADTFFDWGWIVSQSVALLCCLAKVAPATRAFNKARLGTA